jgi:hypothetical protein
MGDDLTPMSECSNWTSFMIHMFYEIDVDYDNYLYHMLIDYTCMLRIGCKPTILNTLNMAKTWLKWLKQVVVDLRVFTTWNFGMSRTEPLGQVGSALLSIVGDALLYNCCVNVSSFPSSSDAADG